MSGSRFAARLQAAWLRRGPLAVALWPLSCLFGALAALRRGLFAAGVLQVERLPVPVVVVGNLVAGGAGKTPTTLALVQLLQRHGRVPGIVSRGFGRSTHGLAEVTPRSRAADVGDEPLLMALRSGVPVMVGRHRAEAGRALLAAHPDVDVIVADDGLQHLRLARDLQVIVFDERGAGNGWLLPAGPLRERQSARPPPHSIVVYNAPRPTTPWPGHVARRRLVGLVDLAAWWRGAAPEAAALAALRGRPVLAAAGVARPGRFFTMLRDAGLQVTELPLPDHHDFATLPWPDTEADVVVTEKDAVKLVPGAVGPARVWVATLDFALGPDGEAELMHRLPPAPRL